MTYGIGAIDLGTGSPAPIISIYYRGWSREQLEVVRETFKSGIILSSAERKPGVHHVYLGTRETISMQQTEGEHTSVLRGPAWDAHLVDVDGSAFRVFQANRRRRGGFLLLVQTGEWEFLTAVVDEHENRAIVGAMLPSTEGT